MSENDAKPFEITGADGNTIEIKHGRYYFNTKSRCERMCLNSLSKECRQVYAAEELLTMGFRTERVRIMTGKDTDGIPQYRDATTADLAGMTGLDPRQVRRALQELDDARLGERRRSDGTNGPLSKGKVTIYSFAEPRSTSAEEAKRRTRASAFSDWPESWEVLKNLARRLKLDISEDFLGALDADARVRLIEEGAEVARVLEKAEKAAARFLKGGRADDALNKEERTDRTSERKARQSSVLETDQSVSQRTDRPTAVPLNGKPKEDLAPIIDAFLPFGAIADHTAVGFLSSCRTPATPTVSVSEVAAAVTEMGNGLSHSIRKPIAFLLKAVPRYFASQAYRAARDKPKSKAAAAGVAAWNDDVQEFVDWCDERGLNAMRDSSWLEFQRFKQRE